MHNSLFVENPHVATTDEPYTVAIVEKGLL